MNLEYRLPNGQKVKFLDDQKTYLGNQLESEFGGERCFGIVANMDFIMIVPMRKTVQIRNYSFIKRDKILCLKGITKHTL